MRLATKILLSFVSSVLLATLSPGLIAAQAPPADSAEAAADAAYTSHDWARAEDLYSGVVTKSPESARFWFRLGTAQRGNRHFDAALASFAKAKELGASKGLPGYVVDYEVAATQAAAGDRKKALEALKTSADAGYSQTGRIENDAEWSGLREDPQFAALAKQVHHNAAPCEDSEFRQFDFWIGDWDVVSTGGGNAAGTSHISKVTSAKATTPTTRTCTAGSSIGWTMPQARCSFTVA
jgi:tetratricopeptide (TPR) repeat protein